MSPVSQAVLSLGELSLFLDDCSTSTSLSHPYRSLQLPAMICCFPFSNITWSSTSLKIFKNTSYSSFSLVHLLLSTLHCLQFVLVSPQPFWCFGFIISETLLSKVILLLTLEVSTYIPVFMFLFILQQWAQIYWEKLRKNSPRAGGFQVGNPLLSSYLTMSWAFVFVFVSP